MFVIRSRSVGRVGCRLSITISCCSCAVRVTSYDLSYQRIRVGVTSHDLENTVRACAISCCVEASSVYVGRYARSAVAHAQ